MIKIIIKGTLAEARAEAGRRGMHLHDARLDGMEFAVVARCDDVHARAVAAWYCDGGDKPPFPTGTLLWYRVPYRSYKS